MDDRLVRDARANDSRFYEIRPCPAPRQSARDRWAPSEAVKRYRWFRDEVALQRLELPGDFFHAIFLIECPKSWSQKKRRDHVGWPHTQKPDADNLMKALIDAVYRDRDDAHVWNYATSKIWAGLPGIVIADGLIPFWQLPVDLPSLVRGTLRVADFDPNV